MPANILTLLNNSHDRFAVASRHFIRKMSRNVRLIAAAWLVLLTLVALPRILGSPTPPGDIVQFGQLAIPYLLVALAPIIGFLIGRDAFLGEGRRRSNAHHFSQIGRWKSVSVRDAIRHPSFGPIGFMASLIAGMLINIVLRTFEFMLAIPALTTDAPDWGVALFWLAAGDTVIMNFFYAVCFVMALRTVPLFPKMLLYTWLMDILLQLTLATQVSAYAPPAEVVTALESFLLGNIKQVLISVLIWMPYLILGERVNVTYRHRIAS